MAERVPTTSGDWYTAHPGMRWPHEGDPPKWPDNYPDECNCNPPAHTAQQINTDRSFHSESCPCHPIRQGFGV